MKSQSRFRLFASVLLPLTAGFGLSCHLAQGPALEPPAQGDPPTEQAAAGAEPQAPVAESSPSPTPVAETPVVETPVSASDAGGDTAAGEGIPISPTTKRMSAGLPEPLPGYLSWPLLTEATAGVPVTQRRLYLSCPPGVISTESTSVQGPLPEGSVILRESKRPDDDFISLICVLENTGGEWKFAAFSRRLSDQAFEPSPAPLEDHRKALEAVSALQEIPFE